MPLVGYKNLAEAFGGEVVNILLSLQSHRRYLVCIGGIFEEEEAAAVAGNVILAEIVNAIFLPRQSNLGSESGSGASYLLRR